jgi:hypothetical protein
MARRLCDEAIRIDKKCTVLYTTDGISIITIPDCHNFFHIYFLREKNFAMTACLGDGKTWFGYAHHDNKNEC